MTLPLESECLKVVKLTENTNRRSRLGWGRWRGNVRGLVGVGIGIGIGVGVGKHNLNPNPNPN